MVVGARMLESHLADVTVIRPDDVGDESSLKSPIVCSWSAVAVQALNFPSGWPPTLPASGRSWA